MSFKVAINIPVAPGSGAGGVAQFLLGLTTALSKTGGDEIEYVLVIDDHEDEWIDPYVGESMRVVTRQDPPTRVEVVLDTGVEWVRATLSPVLRRQSLLDDFRPEPSLPDAGGEFEALGADIVHFPTPSYERTNLPTVFNPHDLLHRHFPENFSDRIYRDRELARRTGCTEADVVDVPSQFVKDDVVESYDVDPSNVFVVQRGSPTELYDRSTSAAPSETRDEYDLPDRFGLYPARPLPHKNHERLFRAVAAVRDSGTRIDLVCTGKTDAPQRRRLRRTISDCGIDDQVQLLGFIPERHLKSLYELAEFVVLPSLFEGDGLPLQEAWAESTPVACSETTALGEKADDAAVTFDPESVPAIADALERLHGDDALRNHLTERGTARLDEFSWARAGEQYRALYRHVAGEPLSERDETLLAVE
jgi:glycosyltransferase involved in cell wall biosynthesis